MLTQLIVGSFSDKNDETLPVTSEPVNLVNPCEPVLNEAVVLWI